MNSRKIHQNKNLRVVGPTSNHVGGKFHETQKELVQSSSRENQKELVQSTAPTGKCILISPRHGTIYIHISS